MKMQQPVACHFFGFNAETRTAMAKILSLSLEKKAGVLD